VLILRLVVEPEGGILMNDSSPSATIVTMRSDELPLERLALVGFLAGYSGPTRDTYRTDQRMFAAWLLDRQVRLLDVQRTHIELYGRWLEQQGRARSTIGRRLSTLVGFYRYCEQELILERSPAAHVRRPKQDYESRTLGMDRNELGAFLSPLGCHRTATTRWRHCWR
jgi:site-specific recombinase XerD